MKNLRINVSKIEYCNLLCCFLLGFRAYIGLFNGLLRSFVGNTARLDTLFMYGILALLVLKCLPAILHSIRMIDVGLAAFFCFSFIFSILLPDLNMSISLTVLKEGVTKCFPLYIGARICRPTERFKSYMRFTAYVMVIYVFWKIYFSGALSDGSYSQYDGYIAYFGLCILAFFAFMEKKRMDFLGIGVALSTILSTGARGPLLFGIGILVFYIVATEVISSRGIRLLIVALLVLLVVVYVLFADTILSSLLAIMSANGMASTRTLSRLAGQNFLEDMNRTSIIEISLDYIKNHIFFGTGIINDRSLLATKITLNGDVIGTYSHNFFLEICMQYGLLLGLMLIVTLAIWAVKCYRSQYDSSERCLFISIVFCGLVPMLVSFSYLTFPMFAFFMGFLVNRTYYAKDLSIYVAYNDLNRGDTI